MSEQLTHFGTLVKKVLAEHGMAQTELAKILGLSPGGLSGILTGARGKRIKPETVNKIARTLGIHPRYLIAAHLQDIGFEAAIEPLDDDPSTMTVLGALSVMSKEDKQHFARIARTYLDGE